MTQEEKLQRLREISVPWEGRERFFKRIRRRRKYRKLIRLRDRLHLHYLNFKDYLKCLLWL